MQVVAQKPVNGVEIFLNIEFEQGRHLNRIEKTEAGVHYGSVNSNV